MSNQKIVTETALSALASDIKTALSGKANSNDVYSKSQTYNRTEIDNALALKADKSEVYNVYPTDQESGSLVHITDGADNIPVKSLASEIVAVESGNGQPKSPDNPYTISGFDNVVITRCGKNLIDDSKYYQLNANIVVVGQTETNANRRVYLPKGTYTIAVTSSVSATIYYDFGNGSTSLGNTTSPRTFTLSENSYCSFWIYKSGGFTPSDYTTIQLEVGDTATTYEEYNGNNYTFTFGQTVYGGYFDNKGNLVVTKFYLEFDGSADENWQTINYSRRCYGVSISNLIKYTNMDTVPPILCNIAYSIKNSTTFSQVTDSVITADQTRNKLIYCFAGVTDTLSLADFKTWLSNNPIKVCYELANPITLAITSQDIPTLLGENNIFSNCGDLEVNYHADIGLYIDKKISSLAQG